MKKSHNYKTSKDYELLFELMQTQRIVCFLDYEIGNSEIRDVCKTICTGYSYELGVRGMGYFSVHTKEFFIECCKAYNVEFIEPNLEIKE
ncbi:MAG: hypothetical protein LBL65_05355 [Campylobacteraceae bacterium]|jgi:hypothetical protein|nr:hypothetical protein [Campylobacteraceae bacterium]